MQKDTLKYLLSPISTESFASTFWEQQHLHVVRSAPDYYREILTVDALDEYLSRNDIRYPSLRMIQNGKAIPIGDFSKPVQFGSYTSDGLIDVDRVYKLYQAGASLVLQLMRSSIRSVSRFANRLQKDLGFNVECTIYVTPPSEQGFTTHYDTHSVVILQIAGQKRWRLYDTPIKYPLLSNTFDQIAYSVPPAAHDIVLGAGDMLYVPRGMAHDATATNDSKSVHITVGLFPPMWRDLFETRLLQLKHDVRYRRAPVDFFLPEKRIEFLTQCEKMCDIAFGNDTPHVLVAETLRHHLAKQSRLTDHWLIKSFNKPPLNHSTVVRSCQSVAWQIEELATTVVVYFYNKRLVLPQKVKIAVFRLLSGDAVKIGELQHNLDSSSSIMLGKRFLDAGLVEIIS